jgi:peptidyl-prolyl cis-trans isomerase B (cyclophilin B)
MKCNLKKAAAIFAAAAILLAGCSKESSSSSEESTSSSSSSQSVSLTAAEANDRIKDSDIHLIQFEEPKVGDTIATILTSEGEIKIRFFPEQAPKAVENFVTHSKNGYYNGLTFHRVICDFMIQGGDPKGDSTGGESIWGEPFKDEFSTDLWHFRGALAMANSGADTNGSQFYIVQASGLAEQYPEEMANGNVPQKVIDKYQEVGGAPWLDGRYTIFGQVIEGMDVIDIIANVPVNNKYKPAEDVIIEMITISTYTEEDKAASEGENSAASKETT